MSCGGCLVMWGPSRIAESSELYYRMSRQLNQYLSYKYWQIMVNAYRKCWASSLVWNVFGGGCLAVGCRSSVVIVIAKVNHRTPTKVVDCTRQRPHPRGSQRQPTKSHQLADRRRHGGHIVVSGKRQGRQVVQLTDVVRDVADEVALERQHLHEIQTHLPLKFLTTKCW